MTKYNFKADSKAAAGFMILVDDPDARIGNYQGVNKNPIETKVVKDDFGEQRVVVKEAEEGWSIGDIYVMTEKATQKLSNDTKAQYAAKDAKDKADADVLAYAKYKAKQSTAEKDAWLAENR